MQERLTRVVEGANRLRGDLQTVSDVLREFDGEVWEQAQKCLAECDALRKDAERYRAFIDCGQPICFLGEQYFGKDALDAAIDAAKGALHD